MFYLNIMLNRPSSVGLTTRRRGSVTLRMTVIVKVIDVCDRLLSNYIILTLPERRGSKRPYYYVSPLLSPASSALAPWPTT